MSAPSADSGYDKREQDAVIAEYAALLELRQSLIKAGSQRFTLFMVLLSATGTVALVAIGNSSPEWLTAFQRGSLLSITYSLTVSLGLFAFFQLIHRKAQTYTYRLGLTELRITLLRQGSSESCPFDKYLKIHGQDAYHSISSWANGDSCLRQWFVKSKWWNDQIPMSLMVVESAAIVGGLIVGMGSGRVIASVVGPVVFVVLLGAYLYLSWREISRKLRRRKQMKCE